MMLRTIVACAVAAQCHAYVVCLPYVSCFEVRNQTLILQLEAYWCPPGGGDFDWEEGRAQDAHGCVFRGLELVARIGAFAGDVRNAVEAGVLALGLPEPEIIQGTILQARNATCQAILSLTLAARQDLGATFAMARRSRSWPTGRTGRPSGRETAQKRPGRRPLAWNGAPPSMPPLILWRL